MNVYGIDIPNKSLTNFDLEDYADRLNIRSFRGVFMRDELPRQINAIECAVVNLDDSDGPGTHWVCYWNTTEFSNYFDSYGLETR